MKVMYRDSATLEDAEIAPVLTVLNYSGGRQSSAILWQLLRGEVARPDHLVVLNADPGMENSRTYDYIRDMFRRCEEVGIEALTVRGPNLYEDLIRFEERGRTRLDQPPYYTLSSVGSRGQLPQKCTREYKIRPMDQEIRRQLERRFGISRTTSHLGRGIVEKWIGFTVDEWIRVKPPRARYLRFAFPLIEVGWTNRDVTLYFRERGLPMPERSVCNACFANGAETFRRMHAERPIDWAQAIAVDRSIRDMARVHVRDTAFVFRGRVPLDELRERGFSMKDPRQLSLFDDGDAYACDSGYCFV